MHADKTVLLPVSTDEAFALITEPDRLRRWKTVSARVDLRAGGQYRWTVVPGHVAAGTFVEVEPGRRVVFGPGGRWPAKDRQRENHKALALGTRTSASRSSRRC